MKSHLTFDIEAVEDDSMPKFVPKDGRSQFPHVPHWKIVCIGALLANEDYSVERLGIVGGEEEHDQVLGLVRLIESRKPTLITFNGRGFDIPVIVARCMRYGIQFPHKFSKAASYRYTNAIDGQLDVMDYLSDFGATKVASMDLWAKLIGMPGKGAVCGKSVEELFIAGEIEKIRAYCLSDVVQEYAIALRVHLVRGLPQDGYLHAMNSLLDAIRKAPALEEFASTMNVKRLMLEQE